ncbi:hypothetical protein SOCE26_056810 [Sorangium cellulosum]|uniref:DUF4833 domain-containing protein n=1 Tax=Sorangium cellulosum TaxID=56 RepID=A0A2L0EY37_SORCE|nr:DUF4833 domain-containing protein [Sorangium cellulosum]AUX44217.1 hypothetical protein SOCE26_056810 [Sorangium cellulosum]
MRIRSWSIGAAAAVMLVAVAAWADSLRFGQSDVRSAFFIAKSENRNQVHYAVRLDSRCMPSGGSPVFPYWRELERGPNRVAPLAPLEERAYGVATQEVVSREGKGVVRLTLRALSSRPLVIETTRSEGGCRAVASTRIAGVGAQLRSVFVQLRWPLGVEHITLSGVAEGGRAVTEKVRP